MNAREHIGSVAWLNSRLTLDILTGMRTVVVDDLVSAVLLAAISNANTSYLDARPDVSQRHIAVRSVTDDMRRPAAVSSMARSLGIPRETARGKALVLVAKGLVASTPDGLILRSDALAQEPILSAMQIALDSARDFIDSLARIAFCGLDDTWRVAGPTSDVSWGLVRLVIANMLRGMADAMAQLPDMSPLTAYVMLAVTHETGAHLGLDAAPTPETLGKPSRGPVRGGALAARLSMPQETVRRHLQRLVKSGRLIVGPGGYAVRISDDQLPLWREHQAQSLINTRQLVWKLQAAGILVKH